MQPREEDQKNMQKWKEHYNIVAFEVCPVVKIKEPTISQIADMCFLETSFLLEITLFIDNLTQNSHIYSLTNLV